MLLFPLLLFSAVAVCDESIKPAIQALQQRDATKAMLLLEPLRSSCGQSAAFYEVLGLASELAGKADGAEEALTAALKLDPKSSRIATELGATLLKNGKPSDAERALLAALVLDPFNIVTLKYAAGAAVGSQDWPRAAEIFQRLNIEQNEPMLEQEPVLVLWFAQTLIETNQGDRLNIFFSNRSNILTPGMLFSLGTLLARHGMYQRAVDYLKRVPTEEADDALFFNLGLCYSHLQQYDNARRAYFQAIDKNPGHVDSYLHIGLDYAASGEPRLAVPWLLHAQSLAPARPDVAYPLAEQFMSLNYLQTAGDVIKRALDGAEADADAVMLVADGDLKRARGDTTGAVESYQKALADKPRFAAALIGLARSSIMQGNQDQARKFLQTALAADPQDPFVNGELGLLEAHAGDWDGALQHLSLSWADNRSNTEIALQLARAYDRKNRPRDALQLLASIRPMMQDSTAFHLELSQVYAVLNQPVEAAAERNAVAAMQAQRQDTLHFEAPGIYVH